MSRWWSRWVLGSALSLIAACDEGKGPTALPGSSDACVDATTEHDASTPPAPSDGGAADETSVDVGARGDASVDAGRRDVTFFAFGDPQYGGGPSDKNTFHVLAMNAAPTLRWPAGDGFARGGDPVGAPRGVIIAGDLTQNGQSGRNRQLDAEWYVADRYSFDVNAQYGAHVAHPDVRAELGLFLRDYGLRGGDGLSPVKLAWRVFEGYGNHDFDVLEKDRGSYGGEAPARDIVSVRNGVRASWPEARRFAPGTAGHYSWDWDGVHLVHLNLVGADTPNDAGDANTHLRDPQWALAFLRDDLAAEVGASCRPVVITMHYGFDDFGEETRWWDDGQRRALLAVLRPYNVVVILHGHTHETRSYAIADDSGKPYNVISLGSPYYQGQPTNAGRGHFAVFHFDGDRLDGADVSWAPRNPDPGEGDAKDLWTGKSLEDLRFQTTSKLAGGWGGWKLAKRIDEGACDWGTPASLR